MRDKIYTRLEMARAIDHAVLRPDATDKDVAEGCRICVENNVGCLIVRPTDLALAAKELQGSDTKLGAVAGFPHGNTLTEVKAMETAMAVDRGAAEVDMVMNVGKFLSGDYGFVESDIKAVVREAKKHNVIVKVILETCYLTDEQIAGACRIAEAAGADFVKTSTGFAGGGATREAVQVMVKTVGGRMGVKASGGIKSYEDAAGYLGLGCSRIGTSATLEILKRAPSAQ